MFGIRKSMNKLVLIGNGFDLAHGLKTKYSDFIEWYWSEWGKRLEKSHKVLENDRLCSFTLSDTFYDWFSTLHYKYQIITIFNQPDDLEIAEIAKHNPELCNFSYNSSLFEKICEEVETKNWVDIEDVYYYFLKSNDDPKQINEDLEFLKNKLIEYLKSLQKTIINPKIQKQILEPFNKVDIALSSMDKWNEMLKSRMKYEDKDWDLLVEGYNLEKGIKQYSSRAVEDFKKAYGGDINFGEINQVDAISCPTYRLPDNIMLLNFNYTNTTEMYLPKVDKFSINHIHGTISKPESVIFGYGDERDDEYEVLMKKNDNEYLRHIKSFRYLEAPNYRDMLSFIESAPYQICIMGHSCGLSDRTLLATLFEHKNCVSIKPYYYKKEDGTDNYRELVQNIARNFTSPSLMRDRVVRKDRCEALGQK